MSLLNILYWVILVLSILGIITIPPTNPNYRYINGASWIALFIIIGLRIFRTSVS
jgi:hypothetical protein